MRYRLWLFWGTVILLTGILPLSNFVGHPQWDSIRWFITTDNVWDRKFLLDIVLNIGLYVPLGFFYARYALTTGRINPTRGVLFAFLLSGSIEFYQVFCDHRFPSMLDLLNNTTGAIIGVVAAKSAHDHLSPSSPLTPSPPDRSLAP
jgi:glycopeptide antibiotics resistance protein